MTYKTGKREAILDFLSAHGNKAFTAEEICDAIVQDGHGKSTVYRIISELLDDGCIRRISDEKTRRCTYQYIGAEECRGHLHLKCRDCGRLYHLDCKLSDELSKKLSDGGFSLDEGAMLFGTCRDCNSADGESEKGR